MTVHVTAYYEPLAFQSRAIGIPQLHRVAGRTLEIIIPRQRRRDVAADAFAVIVAVIGDAFERAERVGERGRRVGRNVGNIAAGNTGPDFAPDGTAGIKDL